MCNRQEHLIAIPGTYLLGMLIAALIAVIPTVPAKAAEGIGQLVVEVEGLQSDRGTLDFGLFDSKESFAKKTLAHRLGSVLIRNGQARIVFDDIPHGDYAVIVAHDVNDDGEISKWPFSDELKGVSNYSEKLLWFPDWNKAKFTLRQESLQITIRVY